MMIKRDDGRISSLSHKSLIMFCLLIQLDLALFGIIGMEVVDSKMDEFYHSHDNGQQDDIKNV